MKRTRLNRCRFLYSGSLGPTLFSFQLSHCKRQCLIVFCLRDLNMIDGYASFLVTLSSFQGRPILRAHTTTLLKFSVAMIPTNGVHHSDALLVSDVLYFCDFPDECPNHSVLLGRIGNTAVQNTTSLSWCL